MPQYLLSVYHAPGAQASAEVYADEAATNLAFERVGAFNASLGERLVFAGGLTPPEDAVTFEQSGARTEGPAAEGASAQLGGLWIFEATDDAEAEQLAEQGGRACGQRVELRRLQG